MRALKVPLTVFILGLVVIPAGARGATDLKRRCAVAAGWQVVAHNSRAIVVRNKTAYPTYRYCSTTSKGFRLVTRTGPYSSDQVGGGNGPPQRLVDVQLRGAYLGYESLFVSGACAADGVCATHEDLWNVVSGRRGESGDFALEPPVPVLLVSPNGLAAWIVNQNFRATPTSSLEYLTMSGASTLDEASYSTSPSLGGLQLYGCAAGCASSASVVAWTHSGMQRYAVITR
jgi:hypothetical protein